MLKWVIALQQVTSTATQFVHSVAAHPPAFLPLLSTADGCSELRSLDLSGCCRIKGPGLAAFFGSAALVRPAGTKAG